MVDERKWTEKAISHFISLCYNIGSFLLLLIGASVSRRRADLNSHFSPMRFSLQTSIEVSDFHYCTWERWILTSKTLAIRLVLFFYFNFIFCLFPCFGRWRGERHIWFVNLNWFGGIFHFFWGLILVVFDLESDCAACIWLWLSECVCKCVVFFVEEIIVSLWLDNLVDWVVALIWIVMVLLAFGCD